MRVIHRETEEKALLRGHALEVVDLKFLPGQDVIATVANDGNVYVWRLSCVGSEIKCVPRPISTAAPKRLRRKSASRRIHSCLQWTWNSKKRARLFEFCSLLEI